MPPPHPSDRDLATDLAADVYVAALGASALVARTAQAVQPSGLTVPQLQLLRTIGARPGPVAVAAVAADLGLPDGAVVATARRLEEAGLVRRWWDDERSAVVTATTDDGRATCDALDVTLGQTWSRLGVDDDLARDLQRSLRRLVARLEATPSG